ncbi:hypothetical protein [Chryseobacterium sp.]|uniref:hypothetical protein n=1 Tax=Chryseobacterium sp. TaxID=1871047 RepID=UPI0028985C94|nr:hypothetical protein [Chryseobacterium sp.]
MKISNTLFAVLMIITSCNANKTITSEAETISANKISFSQVSLSEKTRGINRKLTIRQNVLEINNNGQSASSELSSDDVRMISNTIDEVNIDKIGTYPSPTTKRYSDAALYSVISIEKNGKTYTSSDFDSGNPPQELKELYDNLQRLITIKKDEK